MWIPWLIRAGVRVIEDRGSMADVAFYALLIALAAIGQGIIRTYSRALIFNAGRDVEYDIRNDLFAHLQRLPVAFYHSRRTGDLMSRVINDISAVRMLLGPGILNLFNAPLYYFYAMILMLSMDVRMTLAAILPYPFLIWAVRYFRGKVLRSSLRVQEQISEISSHVQENLSGMHVVKAYTQEDNQIRDFAALNEEYQIRNMELARLRGMVGPFMQGISGLTVLIVIWYGGIRVIGGDLKIADVVAFLAYVNILAWPTAAFGWMLSLVERGRAAMERIEEIFKVEPRISSPSAPLPCKDSAEEIEFLNVSFAYDQKSNGQAALKDISFTLPRGRTLGIVGRIGSGKTTLTQLLARLYDVTSGEIRFGGNDVRRLSLSDLRRTLGYVPQDPFLFSTSLRQNLVFGRDGVSDDEVQSVVRLVRLDRDLEIFPQGLDTVVGERGITLSGGQKQRATLARAVLSNAPVLVLDDCLSSVDAQTEDEILSGLKSILKEKTSIIVSHRISAVKEADEILVLDEGRIIERGNHRELILKDGVYAEMFRRQQLSEELESLK
jgi:ATP-binding cassette subfamily B protein